MNKTLTHILLFLFLLLPVSLSAQRQRNYIYVFDCTGSMKQNGIWETSKQWLKDDLARQSDDASFVIVPFRDNKDGVWQFGSKKDLKWNNLENDFNRLISQPHSKTGICRAWKEAVKYLDPKKENYFILLTDGKDEYDGTEAVKNLMENWCRDHPGNYGFFVTLTDEAKKSLGAVALDCDQFFVIDGHLVPFGAFVPDEITVNLREIKPKALGFSTSGSFAAKAQTSDPNFEVQLRDNIIKDGKAVLEVKSKQPVEQLIESLPEHYQFSVSISADTSKLYITNKEIIVNVDNRPVRNLDFRSEQSSGRISWYDSFFFWPAKKDLQLTLDTETAWNKLARRDGSSITLHASCETLQDNDYELLVNGEKVDKHAFTLQATNGGKDVISLRFAHEAPEGKHFVMLRAKGTDMHLLETINDVEQTSFEHSMRVTYDVVWNPLQWIFLFLLAAIVACLVLWFVVLRPIYCQHFRIARVQVEEPYYKSKRIKGKRKLVFASKKVKQNAVCRFFCGEIVTEVSPEWPHPVELEPYKKGAKLKTAGKYSVEPYTLVLQVQNTYVLQHMETGKKYKITIL